MAVKEPEQIKESHIAAEEPIVPHKYFFII
jgi:hypothetical protein